MAQQTYSNGQTSLLVSDFKARLQSENTEYLKSGVDFLTPLEVALPAYAADYTGSYYEVPSNTSAPTAFSTAWRTLATGKIYEESLPADCRDDGLATLTIFYGTDGFVPNSVITETADENDWDFSHVSNVYWRHNGRKFRCYIPNLYSASANLKYANDYVRHPTYPASESDGIDAPAEDIGTLYDLWKAEVKTV